MLAMIFMVLTGCKSADPDGPTFHQDVAPVLDTHCMRCHTDESIGPMSFETYEQTREWGPAIVASTRDRSMPPKQVVADGTCGDWVDPWWLSDDELSVLSDWVDAGMPEGDAVPRQSPADLPTIAKTHSVTTPEFQPEPVGSSIAEFDEYRCFAMPVEDLTEDMFLTGFDVTPGNDSLVHHVIGHVVMPDDESWAPDGKTNREQMELLDAESPDRLGWPCFFGAGDDVSYLSDPMGWAPGQGATNFPEGHGVRVPEGAWIVVQMHYNMIDPATLGQTDSTVLDLKLVSEDAIDKEMYVLYVDFLLGYGDSLPPGESAYEYSRAIRLEELLEFPISVDIVGMMPHMHERGTSLRVSKRSGGEEQCLLEVPDWDFAWQFIYFYEEPVRLDPDERFKIACVYDTSDATEPVTAGWGTQNEMCLAVVYATLAL